MSEVIAFNNINKTSKNIYTGAHISFPTKVKEPKIEVTADIHASATITGDVYLGKGVMVAPATSIRADEGKQIWLGENVRVEDGVVLNSKSSTHYEQLEQQVLAKVKGRLYGIHIGDRVCLAPQSQVSGPASVGANTIVGMQSLITRAVVGKNCIIEPKALIMGVEVTDDRYVPAGALITTQAAADKLPLISSDYPFSNANRVVANTRKTLANSTSVQIESKQKNA